MSPVGWLAAGMCAAYLGQWLGMLMLSRRQGHIRRAARRMGLPQGSYGPPCGGGEITRAGWEAMRTPFIEGRVQRGNGNGGPSITKPPIKPQPSGGRMVGDDLCPPPPPIGESIQADADSRDPACVAVWPDCEDGAYDPRCCRFPKSCSCGPR